MVSKELHSYIEKLRKNGTADEVIKQNLITAGWQKIDIDQALNLPTPPTPPAPNFRDQSIETQSNLQSAPSMWDAFEHILLFISLYVLATAIAFILHYFIDHWFPAIGDTNRYIARGFAKTMLRIYNASLIVSYPLFVFFFWRITKRTMEFPPLRNLRSRKFLIYLTLVVTFLIMISYIIYTIFSLLEGNITVNFVLHLIVTLTVAGSVFGYYLQQVREDRTYEKI